MRSRIAEALYQNAKNQPGKEAIWCDGRSLTYQEMADLVSRYSQLLLRLGAVKGDHIGIPMNNSVESVALFFSAADLGLCLVPLNPTLPYHSIAVALEAGNVKHLIARKAFYLSCAKNGGLIVDGFAICLDAEYEGTIPFARIQDMSAERPETPEIDGDESFILTMTSGSTGNPKPIDISQSNKYERVWAHVETYHITESDRILAATPLYHSLAERLVILPLMIGATSVLLPRYTTKLWLECVQQQQVTFTIAVSAQLAHVLDMMNADASLNVDSFRCIVSSSALLEESVKLALIGKLKCEFHEMYGTSETSTATDICFQEAKDKQRSVGKSFAKAKLRILRDDMTDCEIGEVGEIAVKSSLTCKGYYQKDKLMAAATYEGYFRTGDLGYLDADGYLYFAGRKKELIITGAVNVYPNDIDQVVSQMEGVQECAAFAYPDHQLGEVVALAIVREPMIEMNARQVQMFCARRLADFQQPHKIFFVDELPKNGMGKLQRHKIIEMI